MPLTDKGNKIKSAMTKEYGEKKGEEVFYASRNKGTISGVDDAEHLEKKIDELMDRSHKLDKRMRDAQEAKDKEDIAALRKAKDELNKRTGQSEDAETKVKMLEQRMEGREDGILSTASKALFVQPSEAKLVSTKGM